jgi:hypothetical protein
MEKKSQDVLDDLFRSKLHDYEVDSLPEGCWDRIEEQLPRQKVVPLRSTMRYWAAAAASLLILIGMGLYFFQTDDIVSPQIADQIKQETERLRPSTTTEVAPAIANAETPISNPSTTFSVPVEIIVEDTIYIEPSFYERENVGDNNTNETGSPKSTRQATVSESSTLYIAQAIPESTSPSKTKRWSFGMGGGSLSANSNESVSGFTFRNTAMQDSRLAILNASSMEYSVDENYQPPKTDIRHHAPISFGLSAGYSINDRWALLVGLNYSYLSSDWKTNGDYRSETEQRLHFIGLPVSLSYRIAECNQFVFYTYAGIKPEVNVAGQLRETMFYTDGKIGKPESEDIRMKEWQWSVNAGAGVSYPLFRYVNAFAELGAGYYFDNGSKIETFYSDKPFYPDLSVGFRLGF